MNPTALLVIAGVGIAVLLLLVLKFRIQAFVALLVVSIGVALAAGVPAADLVKTIESGMGATLGHIAIIIALGAMIGRMIELSGGASSLANTLMSRFGEKRTALALTVAGFILGIPVFFEVGLIILMPLVYGVARTSGRPLLVYALPMAAAMLTVHAFLPPHPGAVAVAGLIGANLGWILLLGIPITAIVAAVGYVIASRMTRRDYGTSVEIQEVINGSAESIEHEDAPSFRMIISIILTPILLILSGTIGSSLLPSHSVARAVLTVLGAPMVALLIALAMSAFFLGVKRNWSSAHIAEVMGSALPSVSMVILVAGAGGVLGNVLVKTGIGTAISDQLRSTGLPILVLAFLMALLLRGAQGSATVALVTTGGILAPLITGLHLSEPHLALVSLAMGAGALSLSHVNDAGYWMFTKLVGLDTGAALRTWTVLVTAMGMVGFGLTAVAWTLA
jgi:GntP family gluconate:H+ symporter